MDDIGCFKDCRNCNLDGVCCTSFNETNHPVLNKDELVNIKNGTCSNNFYEKIDENLFQLKVKDGKCIFFEDGKCSIYEYRPSDCKLYPFDIIKKDSKYYLIIYSLNCIDTEKLLVKNTDIDTLINSIIPWIEQFTDERNYTKMKNLKYKIIREIK